MIIKVIIMIKIKIMMMRFFKTLRTHHLLLLELLSQKSGKQLKITHHSSSDKIEFTLKRLKIYSL